MALKNYVVSCKQVIQTYLLHFAANIDGKASVAVLVDDTLQGLKGLEAQKIIKDHICTAY